MSDTMRAIEIAGAGGPEVLKVVCRPIPDLAEGEALVRVRAAGLNGADLAQRRGVYPPPAGASDLPGLEVSGVVVERGGGVSGPAEGERVSALLTGGGYAEYVAVPAAQVLPLPARTGWIDGAAVMETTATVWSNLFDLGGLAKGQRLLVHGGGSGIGTTAIQMARLAGAEVWCTAGSDAKVAACRQIGADRALNYREESFAEALRSASSPGADVILDMVGGPYLSDNLRSLRPRGRLLVIAFNGGRLGELDLGRLMTKGLSVLGTTLRARPLAEKARIVAGTRELVWPWLEDGRFAPVIDSTFPLERAADAHRHMEEGQHIGKVVLDMGSAAEAV